MVKEENPVGFIKTLRTAKSAYSASF